MNNWTRRKFFVATIVGGVAASAQKLFGAGIDGDDGAKSTAGSTAFVPTAQGTRPLIISSANGFRHLDKGMGVLKKGGDTLDAVLAVVTEVENDPNDSSVGLGGLPNEAGEVELDAQVMHGPSRGAAGDGADAACFYCGRRGDEIRGGRGI